jgi:hypothetical protein
MQHSLFGAIAVRLHYTSELEIEAAAEEQIRLSQKGRPKRLGEILLERNLLTPEDVDKIVAYQEALEFAADDILFGEMALNNGFLSSQQLQHSLDRQKEDGMMQRIGEILVESGLLSLSKRKAILDAQARLRQEV